jgi:N-acetylglucosamine kinase
VRRACADIGGTFITFGHVDAAGDVRGGLRVPTPRHSWPGFVAALRDLVAGSEGPVGLAVAGLVDPRTGAVTSANIPCLDGRVLARELASELGRPVRVANDADCFVLAEANAGSGQGGGVVFGAILGTGVGGGLAIDGRLVRGAGGVTGEWGHGPMAGGREVAVLRCGCGRTGCLDTIGGARGLERLHALLGAGAADSHAIVAGWIAGSPAMTRTMQVHLAAVADQLAVVVNVTGARIVPLGGGLASAAPLVAALDRALRARLMRRDAGPVVVAGALGPEAGLVGAGILARQEQTPCA